MAARSPCAPTAQACVTRHSKWLWDILPSHLNEKQRKAYREAFPGRWAEEEAEKEGEEGEEEEEEEFDPFAVA